MKSGTPEWLSTGVHPPWCVMPGQQTHRSWTVLIEMLLVSRKEKTNEE